MTDEMYSGPPPITRALAWVAAHAAGNRSMRAGGREQWDEDDYAEAVREFDRLWPVELDLHPRRGH